MDDWPQEFSGGQSGLACATSALGPLSGGCQKGTHACCLFGKCPKMGFDEGGLMSLEIASVFNIAEDDEMGRDASN